MLYQLRLSDYYEQHSILLTLTHAVTDSCPPADVHVQQPVGGQSVYWDGVSGAVTERQAQTSHREHRGTCNTHLCPCTVARYQTSDQTAWNICREIAISKSSSSSNESFYVERKVTSVKTTYPIHFLNKIPGVQTVGEK